MSQPRGPALLQMLRTNKDTVYPEDYLKAAGELLAVLFASAWTVTWLAHPEVIESNPIRDVMGYNNLCVGFDMPPATYVGLFLAFGIVYFCVRYAWTNLERSVLLRSTLTTRQFRFSVITNVLYMASIGGFGMAFVVSPYVTVVGHFGAFLQLIVIRFLAVWANVYAARDPAKSTMTFLWVYGVISVTLPAIGVANLVHAAGTPGGAAATDPLVPYQLSMVLDYTWFACLALTTKFVPRGEPLRIHTTVVAPA